MKETLIKMKNNIKIKMVKNLLVVAVLILSISTISAYCISNGYITDADGELINATKINVICKRTSGNLLSQITDIAGYFFPFGDWYDDCTYCDEGILLEVFNDDSNLYGETFNETCKGEINICRTNVTLYKISEPVSSKGSYGDTPDFGPAAPIKKQMPKSNESPETKAPGIKPEEPGNYTRIYLSIIIGVLIIFTIILIRKYGK